jgi:subtilase family serine protease
VTQLSATLSGGNIAISDTEQNIGTNPAGAFTTAFYFASSPISATNGTLIGTRSVAGLAANGASNTASTWFGIPASAPTGTWFVCAVADAGWAISEVNETNNARCTTQSYTFGPDLTVSSLAASISGTNITITDIERNTGNRAANPSVTSFYFAANPNTPTSGTLIGTRSVPGIAAGAQSSAATLFAIPDATPTGTYYVCAASDSGAVVAEFDEGNNTRCTAGTSVIGPDLIVHALMATKAGGTLSVTDMQRNLGNRRAAVFTVSFYLSVNTVFDAADRFLGSRSVPSLAGGGAVSSNMTTASIPAGMASGRYYVLAISDSGNVVAELNEANNSKATAGTYPIP